MLLSTCVVGVSSPLSRSEALLALNDVTPTDRFPTFIHIPKTAGRSIEAAMHRPSLTLQLGERKRQLLRPVPKHCPLYHVPPALFEGLNPYTVFFHGALTFCVVRHPFSRALSEYKMRNQRFPVLPCSIACQSCHALTASAVTPGRST